MYWPRKDVSDTPASNPRSCPHGQIGHSGTPSCPPPTQCDQRLEEGPTGASIILPATQESTGSCPSKRTARGTSAVARAEQWNHIASTTVGSLFGTNLMAVNAIAAVSAAKMPDMEPARGARVLHVSLACNVHPHYCLEAPRAMKCIPLTDAMDHFAMAR